MKFETIMCQSLISSHFIKFCFMNPFKGRVYLKNVYITFNRNLKYKHDSLVSTLRIVLMLYTVSIVPRELLHPLWPLYRLLQFSGASAFSLQLIRCLLQMMDMSKLSLYFLLDTWLQTSYHFFTKFGRALA